MKTLQTVTALIELGAGLAPLCFPSTTVALLLFRLVIAGLVNKEISAELGVTLRTIKEHRGRVMQ